MRLQCVKNKLLISQRLRLNSWMLSTHWIVPLGFWSAKWQNKTAAFAQIDTGNMQTMLSGISTVIDAAAFRVSDRTKLMALVQSPTEDEEDDAGAPAPDAYKSHSGGIVDILNDMKEKAASELSELRKVESNAQHTFNMLKQSLEGQIAADTKDMEEEKSGKEAVQEQKSADEGHVFHSSCFFK